MKCFLFITVILLINAGLVLSGMPHDYVDCPDPAQAVKLVYSKQVQRRGSWLRVIEESISFPNIGVNANPITCILVKNAADDSQAGYATIAGNVGGREVQIKLRSQVGKGLYFSIAIYTA